MGDLIAAHQRTFALRSPILTSNPARIGRRGMGFCREAFGSGRGHLHVAHHLGCHKSWPPSATSNEFLLTLNLMPKRFLSKNGPIFSIPAINPAVGDLIVHEFCSVLPYLSKNRFLSGVRTQKSPVAGTGRKERPQGGGGRGILLCADRFGQPVWQRCQRDRSSSFVISGAARDESGAACAAFPWHLHIAFCRGIDCILHPALVRFHLTAPKFFRLFL